MSDEVFLPKLETLSECAVVVQWCENGSREKGGSYYQTEMGRISISQYRSLNKQLWQQNWMARYQSQPG
ncbi:hypothetical protein [Ruegeria arenilitoris]|uniref:hypothetical protein n=1 Tax=Ruegeria arenilitoris TaxID=1173585 RepID=UPI00147FD49A|nr:hypothetical protein [Ruegeria arenilitoris]